MACEELPCFKLAGELGVAVPWPSSEAPSTRRTDANGSARSMPSRFLMLGRLVEGSRPPLGVVHLAVGSASISISRCSATSPDSETESTTERGIEEARAEPLALLVLPAPGKGIPALALLDPMTLYVERIM